MAWIKRNLLFVIGLAVGVILTGYCGWLFYSAMGENAQAKSEFEDNYKQLQDLQSKGLTKESIDEVVADAKVVKEFETKARTAYALFPPAPKLDGQAFAAYLEDTISDLRLKATNAEVELPPDFAFAFTDRRNKLNYPPENIGPWLDQLTEIKALCEIFFRAKINSLTSIRRIQVSASDLFTTGNDLLPAGAVNNSVATITPYKFTFKCFTLELANVLDSMARSSNCFIVKNIDVVRAGPNTVDQPATAPTVAPERITLPHPPQPIFQVGGDRRAYQVQLENWNKRVAEIDAREAQLNANAAAGITSSSAKGPAITVLREQLLFITLSVDVVKFKPADSK